MAQDVEQPEARTAEDFIPLMGIDHVEFYVGNPFFWAKMALYVIIATLSIKPTRTFIRWKRTLAGSGAAPSGDEISGVRRFIHIELGLLVLLPLMAVLMARGIGR